MLCFVLGMDNSANKPSQNKTKPQDEAKDKLDCQTGVCCPSSWECDDNLEVIETTSLSSSDLAKVTTTIDQEVDQEINISNSLPTDKSEDITPGVESEKIQTTVPDFVETEVTTRNDLSSTFMEPCNPIKHKALAGYE